MSLRLNPRHRVLTVICLVFTALILLLHLTEQRYRRQELAATDWLATNNAATRSPQNPRIVFLAIDDHSKQLDTLFDDEIEKSPALQLMKQPFPWNRKVYALIVDRLVEAGASMVVFDMLFPMEREGDAEFRLALERHGDKVVIGSNLKDTASDIDAAQSMTSKQGTLVLPSASLVPSLSWTDPLVGYVTVKVDEDQIVRHFIYRTTMNEYFGQKPSAGLKELLSLPARALEKIGLGARVPKTHAPVRLRYCEEFLPRSLHEIFVEDQWQAPPYNRGEFFRGKIVLIGAAGNEAEDRLQTPLGTVLAPTVHLNALNAALNSDFLSKSSGPVDLALILGAGALAWSLGAFVSRPMLRLGLFVATAAGYYALAQYLFNHIGFIPILLSPMLALGTSGVTWAAWEQVIDRVERQRTRRALERYVGHDVAHEVLDNPTSYLNTLGGARKEITVLFSDVRGFTTLTETADPHALVKQLNEYFEAMVSIVFANQGTLDKFIGDAVMAHWGSIVSEGAAIDAHRAVTAVMQMRQALTRLNHDWRKRGMTEMHVGFGVNHGDAIVGNLGCEAKMEVSVIGDAVNLGSRLEGATKQYHIDLCIGERVANLVRDSFILRSVDLIVVKGKTKPVEVFTVIDKRNASTVEPPWLCMHEEAVRLFRAGDFAAAETAWRGVLGAVPNDGLSEIFIGRCVELQKEPPQTPWTGVYEMKSK